MRFTISLIFAVFVFQLRLLAQTAPCDTVVRFSDLHFHSDFEQQVLEKYFNGEVNYFELFLATDPNSNKRKKDLLEGVYKNEIAKYNNAKFLAKQDKRKVKKLFKDFHKTFLEQYTLNAEYSQIFFGGNYNCATASAFFALIFNDLDIPYKVMASQNHVYLLAYPTTSHIMVETTNPLKGTIAYNDKSKEQFVDFLYKSKIMTEAEYTTRSHKELFDMYYLREKGLGINELVGVLYYNQGLYLAENEEYEKAFNELLKAWVFHPDEKVLFSLSYCGWQHIKKNKYQHKTDIDILALLLKLNKNNYNSDVIKTQFATITYNELIDKNNESYYDTLYYRLVSSVCDSNLINDVSFIYNYEKAAVLANKYRFSQALSYAEEAVGLNPTNLHAQDLFITCFRRVWLMNKSNLEDAIIRAESYLETYPQLSTQENFSNLLGLLYLEKAFDSYLSQWGKSGDTYLKKFEEQIPAESKFDIENEISRVYSVAAMYYYNKGKTSKAKEIIKRGLEYAPNNYELKTKYDALR